MLNSVSYKISDFFIHNGKIQSEDREVFAYGIRRLILNTFMMISFVCLGFITKKYLEIGLFLVFFIPLRKYAGGFHFDNSVICYVFSCLCVLVGAYMPTLIENSGILQFVGVLSVVVTFWLAPVQDKHKELSQNENKVYKEKTRKILIAYILISAIFLKYGMILFMKLIIICLIEETILIMSGAIKNFCYERKITLERLIKNKSYY